MELLQRSLLWPVYLKAPRTPGDQPFLSLTFLQKLLSLLYITAYMTLLTACLLSAKPVPRGKGLFLSGFSCTQNLE